ncbi:hypothetical protein [Neisseria musculi]|uniref:Uncharacterized protein n=1 Tax=Neisseria musculi TaxID=1815583 RepID=A0A7H1M9X8_9NEIS|nr:hypothetical protein [Neisseria musculi]QNT58443.1 hypothetical protein H7A79_0174 [Neisseria musculi]
MFDKAISGANRFDFGNTHAENTDLVVFGNHSRSGDTKLAAKSVALIGSHRFENLEINSEDLAVIGDIDSNGKFILNAENTHISNGREIAADFPQQVSEHPAGENGAEAAAETPVETPFEIPAETPAAEAAALQIPGLLEEAGFDWDDAETGPQGQAALGSHYQPPTEQPGLSLSEEPVLPENPVYPDILQPEIQTPIQENPII